MSLSPILLVVHTSEPTASDIDVPDAIMARGAGAGTGTGVGAGATGSGTGSGVGAGRGVGGAGVRRVGVRAAAGAGAVARVGGGFRGALSRSSSSESVGINDRSR